MIKIRGVAGIAGLDTGVDIENYELVEAKRT